MKFAATPPYDGTLGRYYRVPAENAYKLPDHLTLEDGALVGLFHISILLDIHLGIAGTTVSSGALCL